MTAADRGWVLLARASFLALWVWQLVVRWPDGGLGWAWLGWAAASIPLLVVMPGLFSADGRRRLRAMIWAGYLAVLYFTVGVAEAWGEPAWMWLQPLLASVFVAAVFMAARTSRPSPQRP